MLYLRNKVGDPNFFCISDTSNSFSDAVKIKKNTSDWKMFV